MRFVSNFHRILKIIFLSPEINLDKKGTMFELPNMGNNVHPVEANTLQLWKVGMEAVQLCIKKRCSLSCWVKENITKKECCFYVEDGREGICMCGYPKVQHTDEAIKPEEFMGEQWDPHRHIREAPTDAYGDISFGGIGQKTSKYIRVSSNTRVDLLYQLMTEQWKLHPPNLLISVTGGAKNFYMKTHLKDKFRRGLIKVAQSTGAWILTGGTHTGVMKHVGMAVRDYTLSSSSLEGQIVTIGVATWGVIHNREALVHPEGRFPAHYYLDEQGQGRLSCLDVNHSHFLLVDDGTNGHYGAEIELRGHLEKLISDQPLGQKESGVKIPVVCVVLDGGPGTLNTIYSSMMNSTPCVILEGSGRVADVIAHVAGLPLSKVTLALIHRLMKKFFGEEFESFSELKIIEWTKKIQDIIRMPELLTVFRIDEEKNCDLDVAILQAFLKASRSSYNMGKQNRERQLELAVAWNRVDIAESEIFTEESQWNSSDLHQAMFSALVGNKSDFVRLLLENGVCIRQFLKEEDTLHELYTHLPSCLFLRKLAKRAPAGSRIALSDVAVEVRHLLGSFTQLIYRPAPPAQHRTETTSFDISVTLPSKGSGLEIPCFEAEKAPDTVWDPGRDLFLWSVIQNKRELAEIAWEECSDCIAAALAASKILKKLAQEGGDNGEEAESMRELASHYEKQAIGVFSECHTCDEQRAQKLLTRASPSWGGATCLRLALEADDKSFIAHSGVQALLTQIWCGELAVDNPQWKLPLCMLFFPLIYTGFLAFRRDEAMRREAERTEEEKLVMDSVIGFCKDDRKKSNDGDEPPKSRVRPLNCWTRMAGLFTCPQVKFYWNIASYFGFLWLFAVVLMMDFQPTPSWREILLYVWLTSLVCEEVRQLFHDSDGFGLQKKAKMYIKDVWNILDVLSIILFIAGLACRLQTNETVFYVGKVVLCIDFIIFCLRLMAIFTISRTLGPKIIIVRRMMMDLFFFMFLLSIWVVAYGVAKQGILIQNEERFNWIVRGAVYEPYLVIFGSLPASIDNTQFSMDSCSVNATDPLKPKCPVLNEDNVPVFPEWLTIIMLCVYLLFANILLLNLLIAIFNYTFTEVQDNTDAIWKFQRYELIKEYHSRPSLPPPFILLSHIYLLITHVFLRRPSQKHKQFRQELSQSEEEELLSWESFMKDNYLASLKQDKSQSVEHRIQDTAEKVGTMSELLEREHEMGSAGMVKRLTRLEEQVCQTARALQWIMDALKSQNFKSKEEAPLMACAFKSIVSEPAESGGEDQEQEKTHHFYARQHRYTGSTVKRFPVPEEKVPWEVEFTLYQPPVYNHQEAKDSDTSALDSHRNPAGRTGIKGRGALKSLGPNHIVDPVITRTEGGVLEFLALWDQAEGCWKFPGGPAKSGENLPDRLKTTLGVKLYQQIKGKMESGAKEVFKGYVDDSRNTDNAWVETTVITVHVDWRSMLAGNGSKMGSMSEQLQWHEVSSKIAMCPYQKEALRLVAQVKWRRGEEAELVSEPSPDTALGYAKQPSFR
ncbi:transient receptor potential cation channel subfamily M member 2-like [Astyanax mexicanus]|uniref:Transient receptor potential cation channel subfamily M member 2-like n=1 Tax=Astyanax mexicanus TaxID=7994 RepID=A0A8T2LHU0_ASTMX|nr:transient receptor potential cation channel subfamily M member 2-like [Astyanax mexicanus]